MERGAVDVRVRPLARPSPSSCSRLKPWASSDTVVKRMGSCFHSKKGVSLVRP